MAEPSTHSATPRKKLASGLPFWQAGLPGRPVPEPPDRMPERCDAIVIGAGVTGAMMAEALSAAGLSVAILERRRPCGGSTVASTALLLFEIDTPLVELERRIGARRAARAWRRSLAALTDLDRLIRALRIECDFRRRASIYLPGDVLDLAGLQAELRRRQSVGLPSDMLDRDALFRRVGVDKPGALISTEAAEVDPARLTLGLLRRALSRGARLFAPADVEQVDPGGRDVEVKLTGGEHLRARNLVFATGYELPYGVPANGHRIVSTWCLATAPQTQRLWRHRDLLWEAADPYLYVRTTADGRVMAGGEDEATADAGQRDRLTPAKMAALQRKLACLLPSVDVRPEYQWSGFFGDSRTGLATIDEIPGMPRCWAVLGYGGNGITFSMMAARMVRTAICGGRDPDRRLFGFSSE